MDFDGDLIYDDDKESEVFVQVQNSEFCVIFRYQWNPESPLGLCSRIVTRFHELPFDDARKTFPDRASMREAIYSSIRGVWGQCTKHPSIAAADVTVEIYEDMNGRKRWRISHESSYDEYVESLSAVPDFVRAGACSLQAYEFVDFSSLVQLSHPGGRGRVTVVRSAGASYVFKGVDFGAYLESRTDFKHLQEVCMQEIRTIASLPPHPNIVPPPSKLVTVRKMNDDQQLFICGALYPFMENGTLEDQIERAKTTGAPISLQMQAKWCYQMISAIAHTHLTALTFHMDIKPANFLLDADEDLILIDWEQSGAPLCTLAPEADGSWDVHEEVSSPSDDGALELAEPELVYEKYTGPERENLSWSRPKWNVFPLWREHFPRALAAAEVFSLGRTMWMLFERLTQEDVEMNHPITVSWSDASKDVLAAMKCLVDKCVDPDPNKRIELSFLLRMWEYILERTRYLEESEEEESE
ncbi:MAG: hypothetical protein Q9220_002689 [cf. Caloplaca sp. 1 TL-2023]